MKRIVLKSLAGLFLFFAQQAISQVTLLSNNTNLKSGNVLNGKGFLFADRGDNDSLWVTNGTAAGTLKLVTNVSDVDTAGIALYNNKIFFAGESTPGGAELWATDATAAGTTLIKDINPTGNSVPNDFVVFNNAMFFTADNGTQGRELWKSDGTAAGTVLLKDINTGAGSSFLYTIDPNFIISNGLLYFVATTATEGIELWKTDGTAAGTTLVKDLTGGTASTTFETFATLGTNLVFSITAGSFPLSVTQLWKSDGTSGGTTMIKDFGALSGFSGISYFLPFNNKLYFDGTDYTNTGTELWVTDATVAGTTLVKDINPGGGPTGGSNPFLFLSVIINNKFYFQATTAAEGSEIWMSDGTPAGTTLLKDINPTVGIGSFPLIYKSFDYTTGFTNTLYNGKVFFTASDGSHGIELWTTDGTSAGTTMVKDINIGNGAGLNNSFSYFYSTAGLYFAADDGSGIEPWLSNGSTGGTSRIADINVGAGSSSPTYLFTLNNQLIFRASNGDSSATDLYRTDATVFALPTTLLNFSASIQPSNAVKLDWTTSTEINSSHFELERSIDGNKFSKVSEVKAAGNSNFNLNYSYVDQQAAGLNSPLLYYRLKLVDRDGGFKTSSVLLVHLKEGALQFTFTPNPVLQQLNVMIAPAGAKNVAVRIADVNGKIVYTQTLAKGISVYQQNINVARLQKGTYYIQLVTDNKTITEKFIKQ